MLLDLLSTNSPGGLSELKSVKLIVVFETVISTGFGRMLRGYPLVLVPAERFIKSANSVAILPAFSSHSSLGPSGSS